MRRIYPLPTDEFVHWPQGKDIGANGHHLGRRILDSGLNITWADGNHWEEVDEPTSPRGRVWRLNQVCWLSVRATVPAPPPGCYAAFFRIRQPIRRVNLLSFSAEWKAAATTAVLPTNDDFGFLRNGGASLWARTPPVVRQESEASASWSHRGAYNEDNPGGWLLVHVGNIMVRESSDTQRAAAVAAAAATAVGETRSGGGDSGSAAELNVGRHGRHVAVSFGGENANWIHNLEVDFAAIAPLRLSWEIERVLMVGNRKGHGRSSGEGAELHQRREEQPNDGVVEAPTISAAQEEGLSPLSCLPEGVMLLVLEFSQPTLVRPEGVQPAGVGAVVEDGREGPPTAAYWKVF